MTLVLYALNRRYYLNEKGAFTESQKFPSSLRGSTVKLLPSLEDSAERRVRWNKGRRD